MSKASVDVMKYFRPLPTLATKRLLLRSVRISDIDDLHICMSNPNIARFELWNVHKSKNETFSHVENLMVKGKAGSCTSWVIERRSDNRVIGMINLHTIAQRSRRAEMGYWIAEDCWHKGYASEAVERVLSFAFERVGLNKICCRTVSDNIASQKLLARMGMTYEGTLREDVLINNEFSDIKMFSLLFREWEERKVKGDKNEK